MTLQEQVDKHDFDGSTSGKMGYYKWMITGSCKPRLSFKDKIMNKSFKVGDHVSYVNNGKYFGRVTLIIVDGYNDPHVIVNYDPNTITDFLHLELDKSRLREKKLKKLGI